MDRFHFQGEKEQLIEKIRKKKNVAYVDIVCYSVPFL